MSTASMYIIGFAWLVHMLFNRQGIGYQVFIMGGFNAYVLVCLGCLDVFHMIITVDTFDDGADFPFLHKVIIFIFFGFWVLSAIIVPPVFAIIACTAVNKAETRIIDFLIK